MGGTSQAQPPASTTCLDQLPRPAASTSTPDLHPRTHAPTPTFSMVITLTHHSPDRSVPTCQQFPGTTTYTIGEGGPASDEELCSLKVPIIQGVMKRRIPIAVTTRDINQWVVDEDLGRLDPV